MANRAKLLVTGASGHLGRRVVELLLEQHDGPLIAVTRSPEALADLKAKGVDVRAGDFDRPESLTEAFRGAERALLVSTDTVDRPGHRIAQHLAAIAAFERAGIRHAVYTSWVNAHRSVAAVAPDHLETERALAVSQLGFTILRNSIYAEVVLGSLAHAVQSGTLVDAKPTGKAAYVTRDDCARVAAAALAASADGRSTLDVTGPEALGSDELAALVSDVTDKPVRHVTVSLDEVVAGMVTAGLPEPVARLYATFETAVENGELASVSDTVRRLTDRAPMPLRDFLLANRAALGA